MATIASPRTPSRYASRDGAGSAGVTARTLVEAPGENPGRRDLHDHGIRGAERRLAGVLRILPVKQVAHATERRAPLDDPGAALDHDPAQRAPRVGVGIDHDGDAGVLGEVLHLAGVVARAEVDLAAAQDVADGHHVRNPGRAAGRHAADALPLHELGGRLREPGGLAPGHRRLASGFARPVREAPAADAPDVLGLDGLDLGQPRLVPGVELGVEAVADHRLVGPGLAHEPRGHVERVSDEADVAERERPQGHEVDVADGDADVDAPRGLDAVEAALPGLRDGAASI